MSRQLKRVQYFPGLLIVEFEASSKDTVVNETTYSDWLIAFRDKC
jgi:hypothetical protein